MPTESNSTRGLGRNEADRLWARDAVARHREQGEGPSMLPSVLDGSSRLLDYGYECRVVEPKPDGANAANAHHTLALYHYRKASAALKNMQFQFAANYLALAAQHLDRAVECAGVPPSSGTRRTTEEVREFVRKLLAQNGSAVEGTGKMMQSLGLLIERLGEEIRELHSCLLGQSS